MLETWPRGRLSIIRSIDGGRSQFGRCFKCYAPRSPLVANRDSGYICLACAADRPAHEKDQSFACGDAWNLERYVLLDPDVEHGPTVVARPPSKDCVACRGSGRIKDKHHNLRVRQSVGAQAEGALRQGYFSADEANEFLAAGGWSIQNAGSSGSRQGRRSRGIRGDDLVGQRIEQISPGFDYRSAHRAERAELVVALLGPPRPVNTQALADFWRVDRSTIWRLRKLGDSLLQQKAPKGGGVFSSAQ